jgi:hypothetical protein
MRKERRADPRPARSACHTGGPLHAVLVTRPPSFCMHEQPAVSLQLTRTSRRPQRTKRESAIRTGADYRNRLRGLAARATASLPYPCNSSANPWPLGTAPHRGGCCTKVGRWRNLQSRVAPRPQTAPDAAWSPRRGPPVGVFPPPRSASSGLCNSLHAIRHSHGLGGRAAPNRGGCCIKGVRPVALRRCRYGAELPGV